MEHHWLLGEAGSAYRRLMKTRNNPPATPRLRFDKVALRLVQGVRTALEGAVPDGLCVVFTVTAPIREPSKTMAALIEIIRAQLRSRSLLSEHAEALYGNEVRIRVVSSRSPHAARVAGFVHNPDPPPNVLLDTVELLLEYVEAPDVARRHVTAPSLDMLRRVCEQVLDADGCATIAAAIDGRYARRTH